MSLWTIQPPPLLRFHQATRDTGTQTPLDRAMATACMLEAVPSRRYECAALVVVIRLRAQAKAVVLTLDLLCPHAAQSVVQTAARASIVVTLT